MQPQLPAVPARLAGFAIFNKDPLGGGRARPAIRRPAADGRDDSRSRPTTASKQAGQQAGTQEAPAGPATGWRQAVTMIDGFTDIAARW